MAVPLRSTCRGKTNSFTSRSRYFASLTTRSANKNDLSLTGFSFILNCPLSIFNSNHPPLSNTPEILQTTALSHWWYRPPPDNPAIIHFQFSIINYPLALRPASALLHREEKEPQTWPSSKEPMAKRPTRSLTKF